MGKRFVSFLILLVLLGTSAARALEEEPRKALSRSLRSAFGQDETLGASVAIAQGGQVVYTYQYGLARLDPRQDVEAETLFRVASVTKMVTAIGVMALVERGDLSLDEDIGVYLGYPVRNPRFPEDPITLRHLLSHTAGIKHNEDYARKDSRDRKTLREMLCDGPNVRKNFANRRPGESYEYSNLGAGIMGSVIEAVTGLTIQDFMWETVFAPLGVRAYYHPGYVPEALPMAVAYRVAEERVAWDPYRTARSGPPPGPDPEDHYDVAVGLLMISAGDLARVVSLLAGDGSVGDTRILRPETAEQMRTLQSGVGSVFGESECGLCVAMREDLVKKRLLYGHQGKLNNVLCDAYFDPETGGVVVMLSNGTKCVYEKGGYVLARRVMDAGFAALDSLE